MDQENSFFGENKKLTTIAEVQESLFVSKAEYSNQNSYNIQDKSNLNNHKEEDVRISSETNLIRPNQQVENNNYQSFRIENTSWIYIDGEDREVKKNDESEITIIIKKKKFSIIDNFLKS